MEEFGKYSAKGTQVLIDTATPDAAQSLWSQVDSEGRLPATVRTMKMIGRDERYGDWLNWRDVEDQIAEGNLPDCDTILLIHCLVANTDRYSFFSGSEVVEAFLKPKNDGSPRSLLHLRQVPPEIIKSKNYLDHEIPFEVLFGWLKASAESVQRGSFSGRLRALLGHPDCTPEFFRYAANVGPDELLPVIFSHKNLTEEVLDSLTKEMFSGYIPFTFEAVLATERLRK